MYFVDSGRVDFVAVTILYDFDASATRCLLGIVLVPDFGFLLARDSNLCFVRRAHADVAAAVADRDAGIGGEDFWGDPPVPVQTLCPIPHRTAKILPLLVPRESTTTQ